MTESFHKRFAGLLGAICIAATGAATASAARAPTARPSAPSRGESSDAVHAAEPRPAFAYYQLILERQPFGRVEPKPVVPDPSTLAKPTPPPPPPPPPQPPPAWIKEVRLVAIIEPDGEGEPLRVGLFEAGKKQSYFINVGETHTYHVIEARFEEDRALVELDNRKYWFPMKGEPYEYGTEPPAAAAGGAKTGPIRSSASAVGVTPGLARPQPRAAAPTAKPALSKEDYDKIKHILPAPVPPEAMVARAKGTAPPELKGEELEKYLREYQMELIRAGGEKGPALPIPLTPEMDEQLVKEGVLPPAGK